MWTAQALNGYSMQAAIHIVTVWLKPFARRIVPLTARKSISAMRDKISEARVGLHERVSLREEKSVNRESLINFNFSRTANSKRRGVSAMLRVKNEESKIYYCLKSIYSVFDEIVLVDNASADQTLTIARQFKRDEDREDKIRLYLYPFDIARCGDDNACTPEDSVRSLAYYYNWCLSKCSYQYVCKWDGDMVLRKDVRESFRRFLKEIQGKKRCGWVIDGQTIYRDGERQYYLAKGEVNGECGIFPNRMRTCYRKVELFELLSSDPPLRQAKFPGVVFYELKFTDENEFSHWSTSDFPTERKRREFANYQLVKGNDIASSRFEKLPDSFLDDEVAS
jgi:glycosyltransferase involved in cell wall biosynthesis